VVQLITDAIFYGNRKLREHAKTHSHCADMGTTIVACIVMYSKAIIANIGDSRAYLVRNDNISQITKDHSLVSEMIEKGEISLEEAKIHPNKNIITRALGTDETVEIDFFTVELENDDMILLCSDGLTTVLDDQEILDVLSTSTHFQEALDHLILKANEKGGPDNISIILIQHNSK